MENNIQKLPPFIKFCYTIGMIPTSYKVSLTYEEQLFWLCDFLENTVIPIANNNGKAIEELQALYVQLQNYVDNYFDNLDIQTEINNKLNDMAESGQLAEIISQYIQLQGLSTFNTVADMKLAENLIDGSMAKTFGFHSFNDGGDAYYKIRDVLNTDVIDELHLFALADADLVAELVVPTRLNVKQVGAYGDNSHDDTTSFTTALTLSNDLYIPNGNYKITDTILIRQSKTIIGENTQRTLINYYGTGTAFEIMYSAWGLLKIENLFIQKINDPSGYDDNDTNSIGIKISENPDNNRIVTYLTMRDVVVRYFYKAFDVFTSGSLSNATIQNCLFQNGFYGAYITGGFNNKFDNCTFSNSRVGLRQRAGEGNFVGCKFETNDIGVRIENPGGRHAFIDCFFENQTTNDENILLFTTRFNEDLEDITGLSFYNCHFNGAYSQLYLGRVKKVNVIGSNFSNAGHKYIDYPATNTVAESWNFVSTNIPTLPSDFNKLPYINNIDLMNKDTRVD